MQFDELKATGKLPSPTGAALRVMELAQQDHTSIADVANVLKADPALAGKVLRVVNSAHTGLSKPTADLPYAVTVLGLRTVRRLVLGFSVVSNCSRNSCQGFDFDGFWRRSLATALACQSICSASDFGEPEEAYCYGLLSRVGQLGLAAVYPERYARLIHDLAGSADLAEAEKQEFGISHDELTAALLADWGLPDVVAEAVVSHEERVDEVPRALDLSGVMSLASRMADVWFAKPEQQESRIVELLKTGEDFEFTSDTIARIADTAMEDWSEWCCLLDIDAASVTPLEKSFQQLAEADAVGSPDTSDGGLRILIVDDDAMSRRYMESHLANAGHEIATVGTGADALRVLLEVNPQIVITDWVMPEMDGLQLCRTIREIELGRGVYVIMVTSHDEKSRLAEAFAAGCDDFLTKPVHPQELCARIRAAARVIRLQNELSRENSEARHQAAELSIGNRKLQQEAWTDALTGLPNRRFAHERLAESWHASSRLGCPFACIMLDIDHFKRINDTYGHPVGDLVLQETAAALQKSVRHSDLLCRIGGEEFLVVCSGIDREDASRAASRLREAVERNEIYSDQFTGGVTVSVGAAIWNETMVDIDEMLKLADDALYVAKRLGRNRVELAWEPSEGTPAPECHTLPSMP